MTRLMADTERFPLLDDLAKYQKARHTVKRHQSVPASYSFLDAHCHVIEGWPGDTRTLVLPSDTQEGDEGQIMLRGHPSQTVTFTSLNFGSQTPVLPTDPSKMVVISWKKVQNSFVVASTGERDWPYA